MKKIHQLEGVRGFGALIVYICHFQLVFVPYFYGSIEAGLTRLLPGRAAQLATQSMDLYLIGCVMLHIFWMLSGYVIFIRFFRPGTGRQESLLAAVCRRYLRLAIPCAVAVLFSYVLLQGGLIRIREVVPSVMGVEFFNFQPNLFAALRVAFWNVYFNFDFVHTYNGPLWTIEKEMYGSLMGFALLGTLHRHPRRFYVYLAILLAVMLLQVYWLASFLIGFIMSDLDFSTHPAGSGVQKALAASQRFFERHYRWITCCMLPVFVIGLHYADPNNYTQLHRTSCLLAILLLIGILRLPPVIRLMEWKPLMHLGKLSFGLYVLHWPVMCSLSAWLFLSSVHLQSTAGRLGVLLVTSLVCYLLSYLFYRYVDAASIKAGALFSRRLDDTVQSSGPLLITPTSPAQNG